MRRFDGSCGAGRRWLTPVVAIGGTAVGVGSELLGFGWADPARWVPDLVVGLVFVGAGLWAGSGTGTLLALTGFTWFAGNLGPAALYWHRGTLVHLLVAYVGWRPRSRVGRAAVLLGYGSALTPVWHDNVTAIALSCALVAIVAVERARTAGRLRHHRTLALRAGIALGAVIAAAAVARLLTADGAESAPALVVYQMVLCAVAVGLAVGTRWRSGPVVADLVVELGDRRSGSLRDALAHALDDPSLQIGYLRPATGEYVDLAGNRLTLPGPGDNRAVRFVDRDGRPFAVLLLDPSTLGDPALLVAVDAATRLSAANAALYTELHALASEVTASRRRLLLAADQERQRLEERLHDGPQLRLARVRAALRAAAPAPGLQRAESQLDQAIDELTALARGLHPRELRDGLPAGLRELARRCSVPVRLTVPEVRCAAEAEAAAYFVCAEALANVAKHAGASAVVIEVARHTGRLTVVVSDDGAGGAGMSRGRGLAGLADRIEAIGGRLIVVSSPQSGTQVTAEIPLDPPT